MTLITNYADNDHYPFQRTMRLCLKITESDSVEGMCPKNSV